MSTEFEHGIYHGRIIFPVEYPMKPPSIILLTVNMCSSCFALHSAMMYFRKVVALRSMKKFVSRFRDITLKHGHRLGVCVQHYWQSLVLWKHPVKVLLVLWITRPKNVEFSQKSKQQLIFHNNLSMNHFVDRYRTFVRNVVCPTVNYYYRLLKNQLMLKKKQKN